MSLAKQKALKATALLGNQDKRDKILDNLHIAAKAREEGSLTSAMADKFKQAANVFSNFIAAPLLLGAEIAANKTEATLKGALQAFTPSTAMPEFVTNSFDVFREFLNIDDKAMLSFKTRSFDPLKTFIEIADVTGGITLSEIAEGEKVKYSTVSGAKIQVESVDYGAGIEISWKMIETRAWSSLVELGQEFSAGVMVLKQKILYGLLVDAGIANGGTIAWPASGSDLDDLISVINQACEAIAINLKDVMSYDATTAPMNLYVHGGDVNVARFRAALNHITNYNSTVTNTITQRQINLIPTFNLKQGDGTVLPANQALLVLPSHKIQYAERISPTTYSDQDIDTFATKNTLRMSFAATVAEVKQCQLLATGV